MIYIIGFFCFFSKDTCREQFINEIVSSTHEYFIVVNGKKENKTVKIVLTNSTLEEILQKRGQSLISVKDSILNGSFCLNADVYKLSVVDDSKLIDSIRRRGKEYFINYFFEGKRLKNNLGRQTIQVIYTMYNWYVPIEVAESGFFIVTSPNFANCQDKVAVRGYGVEPNNSF